jgi:cytochrome c oxidase cbb3-type subunit 1
MTDANPPAERAESARERAAIDESARLPVLVFFASAVFWLAVGTVFALVSSVKMHTPEFLTSYGWLTFGRTRPAHLNTVIYGWATMAGMGVSIWLMARLSRAPVPYPKLLVLSAAVWNVAVAAGTVGILAGFGTSVEWLEFPAFVPPLLLMAFGIFSAWTVAIFRMRREKHVYVTQWYLFGSVFWLPWIYTVAEMLIIYVPAQGVVQAATNWWFAHNFLGLWLTPVGVGAIYYLIPKVIGRPIYSYYLSIIGFWSLALFYSWAGTHHLIGGPLPAWFISAGVVASVMMLIPVGAVAINHHLTMVGYFRQLRFSPTLRFVVFGGMAYTVTSVQGAFEATRDFSEVAHFTHYTVGHAHLGLYGFFSMTMFGCMYYIVPRLTGREWASARLIRLHFWTTAGGISIYFMALCYGGWFQGRMMNDPSVPFLDVVKYTLPFLWSRSLGGSLMAVGHAAFLVLFVLNLVGVGGPRRGPTLFTSQERPVELAAV